MDVDPLTDHDGRTDSSKPLITDITGEHSVELDFLANPSADKSEPIRADDSVSVDSFESRPSSPLITDNNTTTTHTSSNRIRQKCKHRFLCSLSFIVTAVTLTLLVIIVLIPHTLSNLPNGSVVLGTTNATLLLTLNPTDLDQITFSGTEDGFTALFYDSECSDIETERYLLDYTKSLDITEQQLYRIDEFYLVKNSSIRYLFTTSEIQNSSSCVAMIYTFSNHSNYLQFISTGLVREAIFSYCLSPALPLNFTLSVSATENDQFYFVGLESFATTMINYTATGDLLKYNTTSLSPTRCTFPATNCSISLSRARGEDVCILAQILETNKFILLNYDTFSQRISIQLIAIEVILLVCLLIGICFGVVWLYFIYRLCIK